MIEFLDEPLIPQDELDRFMNSEAGGKNLVWNNYYQQITDSGLTG